MNTLRRKGVLLYNSFEDFGVQRILPSTNFSCSGTITKWAFVARSRTGGNRNQYPLFQLWRANENDKYERVYESSISEGMFMMADSDSEFTGGEYIPDNPVPFEAGYIFGVYPGGRSRSRLSVGYARVPDGYGYLNYRQNSATSLEEFDGSSTGNDYPLVAVNTSKNQLISCNKSSLLNHLPCVSNSSII